MKKIYLLILCMCLGCSSVQAGVPEGAGVGIIESNNQVKASVEVDAKAFKEASANFKPGDLVVPVLRVTFDKQISSVFYPNMSPIGEVIEINESYHVVIKWDNGKITQSSPFFLARYEKKNK